MKYFIGVLIMSAVLGFLFLKGLQRHEIQECLIWKKQSSEFRGWYSVNYQVEQCKVYGIDLSSYLNK